MPRSHQCVALVLVLLATIGIAPQNLRAASVDSVPMAGLVDSIRWFEQPSAADALVQLDNGQMDVYTAPIRRPADIEAARGNPNLTKVESRGLDFDVFVNPVPVNQALAPGVFNPFTIREVRHGLNYLIDRQYVNSQAFDGHARTHVSPWGDFDPELGRNPFFFADLDRQYQHDDDQARQMIFDALNETGATYDGTWSWQGNPIVIQVIARIEDQRIEIGSYLSGLLSGLGFGVNLRNMTASQATPIVYAGPPDTGAWMLYTEAWNLAWQVAWPDFAVDLFYNGGEGFSIWSYYTPDPELSDIATRLRDGQYADLAEREQLVERGTALGIEDSVRVWLGSHQVSVHSNRVTGLVYDLANGLQSPLTLRTARFSAPGGTLQVGQPFFLITPWQPWRGFGWAYDRFAGEAFMDAGVVLHPHTGEYTPVRAQFDVTTAGPSGSLDVPATALVYDPTTFAWVTVDPGTTSKSRVSFDFKLSDWHHGVPITMDDVLYQVALIARRGQGDVAAHDPDARSAHDITFAATFRGLSVVDADTLDVYIDYWHIDPSFIAAAADVWPATPWEVGELAMLTTLHDHTRVSEGTAGSEGRDVIDLAKGPAIGWMDGEIASGNVTTTGAGVTRPAGFEGFIGQAEAESRWAGLQSWRTTYGHYYPSNGPYYLNAVDMGLREAFATSFDSYPFPADRWDGLLTPTVPELAMDPVADVPAGQSVVVNLTTTRDGAPYDDAVLLFRVMGPNGGPEVLAGAPVLVAPGTWQIQLDESFTASLTLGEYVLVAAARSIDSPLNAFANRTFAVISSDTVAPTSAMDASPPYWRSAGPFHLTAVATDDQGGVASVDLYAAYSQDGLAWPTPSLSATDGSAPFAFDFVPTSGDGRYRFWSLATDESGNAEALDDKPATGEVEIGFDTVGPVAALAAVSPFWRGAGPVSLAASASDQGSGVALVDLYESFSSDGLTWSSLSKIATDSDAPFTFDHTPSLGDGRYRFWALGADEAGNAESLGSQLPEGEATVGLDTIAPTASLGGVPETWRNAPDWSLDASASSDSSGVVSVGLYVSFSSDGVTWSAPALAASDASAPFHFPYAATLGDGRYRFWAVATDAVGNQESMESQPAEVEIGLDTVAPTASLEAVPTYWRTSSPWSLNATVPADRSGVVSVGLYMSVSADGLTWSTPVLVATDASAPFQFAYTASQGDGRYRFWTLATDAAGNTESMDSQVAEGEVEIGLDTVAPRVVATEPPNGATGVTSAGVIRVRFSEAVDHASAEAAFSIAPAVTGTFSWDGNELIFTPSSALASGTTYRVTIGAEGVTDRAGTALASDVTFQFATAAEAAPPSDIQGFALPLGIIAAAVIVIGLAVWVRNRKKA